MSKKDDQSEDLDPKIAELEAKINELNDKYLRSLADYQNLEKQTASWREDFVKFANQGLIMKLLEVLDDLEKAQDHLKDDGLKIIVDKLSNILKNNGIEEITAEGQDFSPETMEVIQTEPGEEQHRVAKVLQKGYILNGRVIRPVKVSVWQKS